MSADSRRVNFICDKEFYDGIEAEALKTRISVGELIRRALEDKYPNVEPAHPIIQLTPTGGNARMKARIAGRTPGGKRNPPPAKKRK